MPEPVTLHCGDCLEVMASMPAASVDAVVSDPPYGLAFMGKAWDHGVPAAPFWAEALRVAKPGAHLIAFGGTRTFHRLACAIEDAGWDMRDCLMWLYGSGFPKSLNVAIAIDKAAGVLAARGRMFNAAGVGRSNGGSEYRSDHPQYKGFQPATEAAAQWAGYGTALKPAWEPMILARKPLAGTVADNVQRYGTGAINVDGCRIGVDATDPKHRRNPSAGNNGAASMFGVGGHNGNLQAAGRWPANLALDEEAAAALDAQTGDRPGMAGGGDTGAGRGSMFGLGGIAKPEMLRGDTGGASRFFYTAKADADDRNDGCHGRNPHPTVKPIALMRWLVRLVTYPGAIVLDPFMGSGSTGRAAVFEECRFIGIDIDPAYVQIAQARITAAQRQPRLPIEEQPATDTQPAQGGLFGEGNADA